MRLIAAATTLAAAAATSLRHTNSSLVPIEATFDLTSSPSAPRRQLNSDYTCEVSHNNIDNMHTSHES